MRILVLSAAIPFPPVGGGKARTYHLLRALTRDHELTLAGFTYGEEPGLAPYTVRVAAVPWEESPLYRQMTTATWSPRGGPRSRIPAPLPSPTAPDQLTLAPPASQSALTVWNREDLRSSHSSAPWNLRYETLLEVVGRFWRSALVDIDRSLLRCWKAAKKIQVAGHGVYFSIGETVGQSGARSPDRDGWQPYPSRSGASFTTVSHWYMEEWE